MLFDNKSTGSKNDKIKWRVLKYISIIESKK